MNTTPHSRKGWLALLHKLWTTRTGTLLPLFLLLLMPAVVQAQFTITTNNSEITITGYAGFGGAVKVPDEIDGFPVTSIGDYAFADCTNLTGITLGINVSSIGERAFSACTNLVSVTFCTNLTAVGDWAFISCIKLSSASLPPHLPRIGLGIFSGCWSLANVSIPSSVTSIGTSAFSSCGSLTSIPIPGSVTSIGTYAFYNCSNLTSMWIPAGVTSIGDDAFGICASLTAIGVDTLNPSYCDVDGVLFNRTRTTLVVYPGGKGGSYAIPNGVTRIGNYAFANHYNLTNVTIPSTVTAIGRYAFYYCTSLPHITLPNHVTTIAYAAFDDCHSLSSVVIPNSVTTIENWVFGYCTSLRSIAIPKNVTYIGTPAFDGCSSLTAITVDTLNPAYCSVDGVLFDKNLTTIVRYPQAKAGDSYAIPEGVTAIGQSGLYFCSRLKYVVIPASVSAIQNMAFYLCTGLQRLYFKGNAPAANPLVFASSFLPTVCYWPGTTGWEPTFASAPTAPWPPPSVEKPPQPQTAEAGTAVVLRVWVNDPLPLTCTWYQNATNLVGCTTNYELELPGAQFSQVGSYTVVVSNAIGAVTSAPALLNVIPAVTRRPAVAVRLTGETGSVVNVAYADSVGSAPSWLPLDTVTLVSSSQYCFDVSDPLPAQRYYTAWQSGPPAMLPSLSLLGFVTAIPLTGSIGDSVRVDCINRFGPIDAWTTLDTVTLTNTSQLYFDVSAWGQPQRLYQLVPLP